MVIGCIGLWVIKLHSDPNPRASMQSGLDYSFIIMLFLSSASGLIHQVLRVTSLMPILLAIHLAIVLSLFVMLPYSKFVHAGYRFIALIKFSQDTARERHNKPLHQVPQKTRTQSRFCQRVRWGIGYRRGNGRKSAFWWPPSCTSIHGSGTHEFPRLTFTAFLFFEALQT